MNEIFSRRSIRTYTNKEISDNDLQKIIKAGMNAPSARNLKPYEFIVVKDKNKLEQLSNTKNSAYFVKNSNTSIIVLGKEVSDFWQQDLGATTQNMLLEATYLNIGSCWVGITPNSESENYIKDLFDIPKEIRVFNVISLGYSKEQKEKNNFYDESKVHYNNY